MAVDGDQTAGTAWTDLSVEERYRTSVGGTSESRGAARPTATLAAFRRYLMISDVAVIAVSVAIGLLVSSRASTWAIDPVLAVYSVPPAVALIWFVMLAARGTYDQNIIGLGTEEIRRVISASLLTFAVVAGASYLFRADISRAYAFVSLPLGILLIVGSRFGWRVWLYRARTAERFMARTLIIGQGPAASEFTRWLSENSYAGYEVAGHYSAALPDASGLDRWLDGMDRLIKREQIDAVALAPFPSMPSDGVNQIGWRLEGRRIDFLIAPAILDVAGPRLSMRPVSGLPILHLNEAVLSRSQRPTKRTLDITLTVVLIVLLSPVMLACTVAVLPSSRGPVIFRQSRVGWAGQAFTKLKFPTMVDNAEALREELRADSHAAAPMFKLKDDPRVTPVGRFLRRWLLDELPQLFNVLGGSMSVVDPRPHPLDDVNRYEIETYRRLGLKPGLVGLWQVGTHVSAGLATRHLLCRAVDTRRRRRASSPDGTSRHSGPWRCVSSSSRRIMHDFGCRYPDGGGPE